MARSWLSQSMVRWSSGLLASVALVAVVTGLIVLLEGHIPVLSLLVLYLLAVLPIAIFWGSRLAAVTAVLSVGASALMLPPRGLPHVAEPRNVAALAVFLVTAVVVGELAARFRRAAVESARLSDEQSALRRVAIRFESNGVATFLGGRGWSMQRVPGTRFQPHPGSALAEVRKTGLVSHYGIDDATSTTLPEGMRQEGMRYAVDAPILVEGHVWGAINVSSRRGPLPLDIEQRIVDFTELIGTAIANADAHAKLTQSRARIVATADATRRRIERDLHDGAQQRLVSLALELRLAQESVPAELPALGNSIGRVADELAAVQEGLREISRGIHPSILSEGGLGPAVRTLARRSPVPVELDIQTGSRYPPSVEVAAYYVASEALTNTAKYADASHADVAVWEANGTLRLRVLDDGVGGLRDRRAPV
jgi:signal transduction histidine kinase